MQNVYANIPYNDEKLGRRKLVDEKHLLVMQIALKPGQAVPHHNANSNVRLLVLEGEIQVTLAGIESTFLKGDLAPVAYGTPMDIVNNTETDAMFLVWKAPNPSEMKS